MIYIAINLALAVPTVLGIYRHCRRNQAVPAWAEWLLVVQIVLAVTPWLPGFLGLSGWLLGTFAIWRMYREMRAETRRMTEEIAAKQEERRWLMMRTQAMCQSVHDPE